MSKERSELSEMVSLPFGVFRRKLTREELRCSEHDCRFLFPPPRTLPGKRSSVRIEGLSWVAFEFS